MRMGYLLIIILALARAAPAAHCACSGEAFPGAAQNADIAATGGVNLSWGLAYNLYENIGAGEFEARVRSAKERRYEGPEASLAAGATVTWGLGPSWQLSLSQSWQRVEGFREGRLDGTGAYERLDHGDISGLKDLGLDGKLRVIEAAWGQVALLAGLSLPTGQQVASPLSRQEAGNSGTSRSLPLPLSVQPGRGSLDGNLGLAYSVDRERWRLDLSVDRNLPSTTRGYRSGDKTVLGLALGWKPNEHDLLYLDLVDIESAPDVDQGRTVWASGGAYTGAGLRASVSLAQRNRLSLQWLWPLNFGTAGEEGARVAAQAALSLSTLF